MVGVLSSATAMLLVLTAAQPAEGVPPAALEALLRCRSIAEEPARLRCFDEASARFETATRAGEVLVVDRQQVRQTRRRLFGLPLPDFNLFGGGERSEDRPRSVTGEIAGVSYDGSRGGWIVTLRDGAVWAQTDNATLALQPRVGQRVVVNRAALGTFMMRVANQPGIRVRRVR